MPAPRLQDKKLINAALATERKREVEKGRELVKSIEALQQAERDEKHRLEEYRANTIQAIQIEIDTKVIENQRLSVDNKRLKEESLLAQAPIDLKEEWQSVREDKVTNLAWEDRLSNQAIELLAREEDVRTVSESLIKEKKEIQEEYMLSRRTLAEAEAKYAQAEQALERAEREAQTILRKAQQRENHVNVREEDANLREMSLSKREDKVSVHEVDLRNREIKLKSRQEMFLKAKNYIKNKK